VLDPSIATLTPQGLLTALKDGHTVLTASRGAASAATVIGVGMPSNGELMISRVLGIDAYPDTVTVVPAGGTRQIVTSLGLGQQTFVTEGANGTRYVVGNSAVATVTEDGLIRAVGEGETTVTVIYGHGEEVIRVKVQPPLSTNGTATVGQNGGVVANADGIMAAFGPGQFTGNAVVTIATVAEDDLSLALPSSPTGETTFGYLGAFDIDIQGGELNGPFQVAVPVAPGSAQAGDTVFFFEKRNLPVGENGEFIDVWTVVDSGTVGEDGMARTASPPFPGLSTRGSVLIARAAQPLGIVRMDLGLMAGVAIGFAVAAGVALVHRSCNRRGEDATTRPMLCSTAGSWNRSIMSHRTWERARRRAPRLHQNPPVAWRPRKRTRPFFMKPSYFRSRRCCCICDIVSSATPTTMRSEVPPNENGTLIHFAMSTGRSAITVRKIAPGSVIRETTPSMYSAVFAPGFTPGMKPPFRFMSSASWFGFTVMAV